MKLGSRDRPVPELLGHGVNVALGTDGMCSNDGNDMFATLKTAALLHKLWEIDYERWLGAREAWRIATVGGAHGRRRPRRARAARARAARRPRAARPRVPIVFTPLNDPLQQLALGSTTLAVSSVLSAASGACATAA